MPLPQRLGCLGWTLIASGLALTMLGAFALWFLAEADLRAALDGPGGRPPAPPPWPVKPRLPPPVDDLRAQALALWRDDPAGPPEPRLATRADARVAVVPPGFPAVVHRALAAARGTGLGIATLTGGWRPLASVRWALAVRIVRDPSAALPALAADAADLALLVGPRDDHGLQLTLDGVDLLAWAVTMRLADLGPPGDGTSAAAVPLATVLRDVRERLWRVRGDLPAAELARRCAEVESRSLLRGLADGPWADLGRRLLRTLELRRGRAEWIRAERDRWWAYAGAATPADLVARVRALPKPSYSMPPGAPAPPAPPPGMLAPFQPHCALARTLMTLDVLIAALDAAATGTPTATPPAEDAFAPGHPLHPLMRPGDLGPAGWYSVGEDGRDDGGDPARDIVFASRADEDAGR